MRRSILSQLLSALTLAVLCLLLLVSPALAEDRIPGERWMHYTDPADAGFDGEKLAAAAATWKTLPSAAFMVVADGAVVTAWGETDRRFMCHSVRKSFLSALFGVYWDQGEIELNKTLADLGIDEDGEGLLESEKRARILDLLKARSGVFHPAAYAGRTDSRPRGSEGPGRYFAYNNWDFNTLAAILEIETGDTVFEAFDTYFGKPLGMEDWRVSDGYFHFERDKSRYPAYPFRMSARDAARFGLLFARDGLWGDERILSTHWVRRSTALYSIDSERLGYGFMWWVSREPRFEKYGFVAALGVGNQMIAVLPEIDLVIVNRANTYERQGTPMPQLLDLIAAVLDARTGTPATEPRLAPMKTTPPDAAIAAADTEIPETWLGEWPFPPSPLGLPQQTTVTLRRDDDHLVTHSPLSGTFVHTIQADGSLLEEDSLRRYHPIHDSSGTFTGIADADSIALGSVALAARDEPKEARRLLAKLDSEASRPRIAGMLVDVLSGRRGAERRAKRLAEDLDAGEVESTVNLAGYQFFRLDRPDVAQRIFELNTRLFPDSSNVWDSLGEVSEAQGNRAAALSNYSKALELDPGNSRIEEILERLRSEQNGSGGGGTR